MPYAVLSRSRISARVGFTRLGWLLLTAVAILVVARGIVARQPQPGGQASSPSMTSSGGALVGIPGPGVPTSAPTFLTPRILAQLAKSPRMAVTLGVFGQPSHMPDTPPSWQGTISGKVLTDGGKPLAGAIVTAYRASDPFMRGDNDNPNTATTGTDGRYVIHLQPYRPTIAGGPFIRDADGYTVFVNDTLTSAVQPLPINVNPDALRNKMAANVNFNVLENALATVPVTVQVVDATAGTPVPGVTVYYISQISDVLTGGKTGPNGIYTLQVPRAPFWLQVTLPPSVVPAPGYGDSNDQQKEFSALLGQSVTWQIKTSNNIEIRRHRR